MSSNVWRDPVNSLSRSLKSKQNALTTLDSNHNHIDLSKSNSNSNTNIDSNSGTSTNNTDNNAFESSLSQVESSSVVVVDNGGLSHSISPSTVSTVAVAGVGGTVTTVTRGQRKTAPLPRLVAKNGTVNLFLDNIDRRQYMRDLFTTMIDIKWRYNLMAAAFGFVFSWILFACIWYSVLYMHGDLGQKPPNVTWSPCIVNVESFPAALLFSIETQSTLGFGSRTISDECPHAIIIFCIQLIFGVVVECLIVGMVFAKLSRPAKRSQTIMFSKNATICLRGGRMVLTFRVGDVRSKSHIIGATIRASLVCQRITEEGETIPFYHHQLDVRIDDSKNNLLLIWPVIIVHHINETSPFYRFSAEQLASFKFEIITVLEGIVESTGQSIQVRSSYLPSEVKWGYRFEPVVLTHGFGHYAQTIIDYNKFNKIMEVETPKCSAMDYYASRKSSTLLDATITSTQQSMMKHC